MDLIEHWEGQRLWKLLARWIQTPSEDQNLRTFNSLLDEGARFTTQEILRLALHSYSNIE